MALVVDIETVGVDLEEIPPRALDYLFRNLRRDGADEREIEARRKEMIERFSLDPTTGRIVCIGLLDTETGEEKALYGGEEKVLLLSFWKHLALKKPRLFVTFNGKSFDFPFISIRSAILEVPPSLPLPMHPLTTHPHMDLREVLAGSERHRRGSLDFFCTIFGIPSPKEELNGSGVGAAYRLGRLEEIARYCIADCRATAVLYERLRPYFTGSV